MTPIVRRAFIRGCKVFPAEFLGLRTVKTRRNIFRTAFSLPAVCALLLNAGALHSKADTVDEVWGLMNSGQWSVAEKAIEKLKQSDPQNCNVYFAAGNLWQHRQPGQDIGKATQNYQYILQQFPDHPLAPWTQLALARMADLGVIDPAPDKAVPLYRIVMEKYPESDAAQEAALYLALADWNVRGDDAAEEIVENLRTWRAGNPNPEYSAQFDLLIGKFERYPLGRYQSAATHLMSALERGLPSVGQRRSTCLTVASLADEDLRDRDLAIRFYTKLLADFPPNRSSYLAKMALRRLGADIPPAANKSIDPGSVK